MNTFKNQLKGERLITAEILYHMPDHPKLLQTYIWQEYDLPPIFPELLRFIEFWECNLDGKLHSVRFDYEDYIKDARFKSIEHLFKVH